MQHNITLSLQQSMISFLQMFLPLFFSESLVSHSGILMNVLMFKRLFNAARALDTHFFIWVCFLDNFLYNNF